VATRLETPRLVLRTYEPRDVGAWIVMFRDPAVTRFLDPSSQALPRTAETFQTQMRMRLAMEAELGYAMLAVEHKATGEFIGQCGIRPAARMDPSAGSEIDLGYHFIRAWWGQDYATEAVIAVLAHGLGTVGLPRVMAVAEPENVGSWRVMEKAGMQHEGSASYYGLHDLKKYVAARAWWQQPAPGALKSPASNSCATPPAASPLLVSPTTGNARGPARARCSRLGAAVFACLLRCRCERAVVGCRRFRVSSLAEPRKRPARAPFAT
jgi:RimJ/RimL family protein N-acetyltransferase